MSTTTVSAGRCIPLRSWSRVRNHGDRISADIVRLLFEAEPIEVPAGEPHVLAVGSNTFMANGHSTLWGSGVLNRQVGLQDLLPQQIRALRGRHSADLLAGHGIRVPDIPLGDPGIFAADLLRRQALSAHRGVGIVAVPHHGSIRHDFFTGLADADGITVADTLNNDWGLLQDIAGADVVVSESLRGLIYAESFGKPSVWISKSEDPNWVFKFHDWFSTTHNPQRRPASMSRPIGELAREAEYRFSKIDKAELLAAFPHDQAIDRPARLVGYERCRLLSPMTVFGDGTLTGALEHLAASAGENGGALAAFDQIRARIAHLFELWAELPYVCIVDARHTAVPTDVQKRIIAVELDRRVELDFGIVVDKRNAEAVSDQEIELGGAVSLFPGARTLDGCLMLRPSLDASSNNHGVFGI